MPTLKPSRPLHPAVVILALFLATLLPSGCSSENNFVVTANGSSSAATGNVEVLHPLAGQQVQARTVKVDPTSTQTVFVGKNAAGDPLYGPFTFPSAPKHLLTAVPVDVTVLEIEYRNAQGVLEATGKANVRVIPGATVTVSAEVQKSLTIQVVNESETPDDQVYLLLSANGTVDVDLEGGQLAIFRIGASSSTVTSSKLTSLHSVGTRVSPLTGRTCTVYEFVPQMVVSGRLWVSYGGPLTYSQGDNAPGNFENVRYDKMELGYNPGSGNPTGFFDLTAVDFFAIPMQLEVLADPADTSPLRITTFYTSTQTLLNTLYNLDPANMANSFYKIGPSAPTAGWSPSDDLSTFARAMSPATLVSFQPAQSGDPFTAAPYPSFFNYLATVANQGIAVILAGANGVDGGVPTQWNYQASVVSDGAGGFIVRCRPSATMSNTPQGSLGDLHYPIDPQLPKDLEVDIPLTADNIDAFVYGVPANAFSIKNLDAYLVPYAANSVYANIGGNFLAGLNLGYVGGVGGDDGTHWFDALPGFPPYAAARENPADGYYNPYAAVLYNLSDAYSFSISDRLQNGNPLVTTSPSAPYLRLTILPDSRLDAPANVKLTQGSDNSLVVNWDAIATPPAGFTLTGYKVTATDGSVALVAPTTDPAPTTTTPNQTVVTTTDTTATLTGLEPGTAYQVTVVATGTHNGTAVQSASGQFATLATPLANSSPTGSAVSFVIGLAPPANLAPGIKFYIDGREVSGTQSAPITRPAPGPDGEIVRALFETTAPNPADPSGPALVIGQTNVLLNLFPDPDDSSKFNPYFNFPFSSTVPGSGQGQANLLDGSFLNFAYNTSDGEPPFNNQGNTLSVNVSPNPTNAPKSVAPASFPNSTPVVVNTPGPDIPAPSYTPAPHTPVPATTFKVQAVRQNGASVSDLEGAIVHFVRLVTYPTNGANGPNAPGADGGGFDAASVLDQTGAATFDPTILPYSAPIWNLGYRVDVIYQNQTYSAYGAWRTPAVGAEWTSGLAGQPDVPGTIYVPIYSAGANQTVWGNGN